jgi:hypothetical protein
MSFAHLDKAVMATEATDDDESATLDDLVNEVPSTGFRVTSNNEEVDYYPDAPGAEYGVIKHKYDGLPARGIVLYDVVDWEIVDMDFEPTKEDATMQEEFEYYEGEIREWIEDTLFTSERTRAEANFRRVESHTIEVENPWEGDSYTIKLETANKRRVA